MKGAVQAKGGFRSDLGIYVRSAWEANYSRYLNWLVKAKQIAAWKYEPCVFTFPGIKRGCTEYRPDFAVVVKGSVDVLIMSDPPKDTTLPKLEVEYHEVKGWMDAQSKTKLKRMAKYFPEVKIVVIDAKAYRSIARDARAFIPEWE